MSYEIKKGDKAPNNRSRSGRKLKYPFDEMEINDYIIVEKESAVVSARAWAKRKGNGYKFTTSPYDNGMFQLWRSA